MRKALAFIMVLLVFCCSVSAAVDDTGLIALEGVCDGVVSAITADLAVPRIALQGVDTVHGDGVLPLRISFVRSDVFTYSSSLSFFGSDVSAIIGKLALSYEGETLRYGDLPGYLNSGEYKAGDVILDGSVRLVDGGVATLPDLLSDVDWSRYSARLSLSLMVTGTAIGNGCVVEGNLLIQGMDGRAVTVYSENLKINNEPIETEPVVISFGS